MKAVNLPWVGKKHYKNRPGKKIICKSGKNRIQCPQLIFLNNEKEDKKILITKKETYIWKLVQKLKIYLYSNTQMHLVKKQI